VCGLAGNTGGNGALAAEMLERIKHRGPDGDGVVSAGGVTHGHVRLALLDLSSASAQPFRLGDSVLAFNGEIWNHREVRERLERKGRTFRTTGDTEVLAVALDEEGLDCLPTLDGMFAFSWSHPTRGHWLVRDEHGKVPLYVRRELRSGALEWASERKAWLHGASSFRRGMPPPSALAPGAALNLETGEVLSWKRARAPEAATPENVLRLLRAAVERRLFADAPVCCLISGGLDSSLILALAKQARPDVVAFTVAHDETARDLSSARRICEDLDVPLVVVRSSLEAGAYVDAVRTVETGSKAQVEIGALCLPLAREIARQGFKACLSGEAADELFGGYAAFLLKAWKQPDAEVVRLRQWQVAKMARGNFPRTNKAFLSAGVECRLPFMDPALVDLAVHATWEANPEHKKLLKAAAETYVPSWCVRRTKHTFQQGAGADARAARLFANPKPYYSAEVRNFLGYIPPD